MITNGFRICVLGAITSAVFVFSAAAQTETVLHIFTNTPDGYSPAAGVIMDKAGNLFGTTASGGTDGNGFVFELSPPTTGQTVWTETALYSFPSGGLYGAEPESPLWFSPSGNLLGATLGGGNALGGAIFKLTRPAQGSTAWTESVLYNFDGQGLSDSGPLGSLLKDSQENRYGVTMRQGTNNSGTVYRISAPSEANPSGTYEVLHSMNGENEGSYPVAGLVSDANGNLYGAAPDGGTSSAGVIFELSPPLDGGAWVYTVIYTFRGFPYSGRPGAKLFLDPNGSLFGTTFGEDDDGSESAAFRLTPPSTGTGEWVETDLYDFGFGYDVPYPTSALIPDGAEGFYGTTNIGGLYGFGTVFRLAPVGSPYADWGLTTIYNFAGGDDGAYPAADLLYVGGVLYGVTAGDGLGATQSGTVFALVP